MREIKFRAWDKTAKQMYQVDILGIGKYDWQQYAEGNEQPQTGKNKFYPSQVEIMQYTGLKDKNGVEIYEGDIIKYIDEDTSYTVMFDPTGYWCLDGNGARNSEMLIYDDYYKYIEVIGNIYDKRGD